MSERVLTAHVPTTLATEVDRIAERLDRPRGWVVKEALTRYVELERKRDELTREALADVDEGRLVDHGDIVAWATSISAPPRRPPRKVKPRR